MNESKDLTSELEEAYNNNKSIYDYVGQVGFGQFALMKYQGAYYIAVISNNPYLKEVKFSYVAYATQQSAGRAWGHICERFERWWIEQNA